VRLLLLGLCLGVVSPAAAGDPLDHIAACKLVAGGTIVGSKLASSDGMPRVYLDWLDPRWATPSVFTCEFDASAIPHLTGAWVAPPCDCNIVILDEATLDAVNERLRNKAAH